jgi:hypothetical protein
MKRLIVSLLLISVYQSNAQKNIDGLINTEKSFAAYSVANGTKSAFLKFLDSSGIVFDQAKAVNGFEIWNWRVNRPDILNWHPQFAEIALSNDFGYTTGPWTLQKPMNDTVIARGQYFTIWHFKDSVWKFLLDLGTSHTPVNASVGVTKINVLKRRGNEKSVTTLLKAEKNFIAAAKNNLQQAYRQYLSKQQSILNRNNYLPAFTSKEQENIIQLTSPQIGYTILGYGISSSGDLGYVYGTSLNPNNARKDNYVRVWRKEKDGWKIAVEVLRY